MNLDGKPVMMIDNYFPRAGGQFLLFANTTDIFLYDESTREVAYLTPRYETGTVSVTNGSAVVTGSGTTWGSDTIKAGTSSTSAPRGDRPDSDVVRGGQCRQRHAADLDRELHRGHGGGQAYAIRLTFTGDIQDYWETAIFFAGSNYTVGATEIAGTAPMAWTAPSPGKMA